MFRFRKTFFFGVIAFGIVALTLIASSVIFKPTEVQAQELRLQSEYLIPGGYKFLAGANHGLFASKATFYCTQNSSGNVFVCDNYKVGRQIIPPDGFTISGASSDYFLCTENSTGKLFTCVDK